MSDQDSLYAVASELLGAAASILGWGSARKYVSVGEPAYDCCPQLTVQVQRVEDGPIGPTAPQTGASGARIGQRLGRVVIATLQIDVIGCVPTGDMGAQANTYRPPAVADLEASSAEIYAWGWALRNGLSSLKRQGDLFGGSCQWVDLGIAIPITPEGGCAGWRIPITVQLDGYDPA